MGDPFAIAVIIPTYNRRELVVRAVESVLRQTFPAAEVVVVDDGSEDGTAEALQKMFGGKITLRRHARRQGVAAARNTGIKATTSPWLALLDSDDVWHPTKLEEQVRFHQEHPDLLISQCDEIWIRHGVRVNPKKKHRKQGGWIFTASLPLCIVSPSAVFMHRSVLESVGLFDEGLPVCEDYDLWLRIGRRFPIGFLPRLLLTRYGGHADQLSHSVPVMDRYRIQAMEKHLDPELKPEWRRALLGELVRKCRIVAQGARKRGLEERARVYSAKVQYYEELLRVEGKS